MKSWFTVEQIDQQTYVIREPLHYEETNCYLLLGSDKALLIDSGMGIANISEVVHHLTSLPVIVIATHIHWDHIGGHKYFAQKYVHKEEQSWMEDRFPLPLDVVKQNLLREECTFPTDFDIDSYTIWQGKASAILHNHDCIDIGGRIIEVYHTPGHSPGHMCFYECDKAYLYTGDLAYEGILYANYPTTDPIAFMNSLASIASLPVNRILPAHHTYHPDTNLIKDIKEAFHHLYEEGKLKQGNGLFSYDTFKILI